MAARTIRTNFIIDVFAPTIRSWTNYPGGITVPSIVGVLTLTAGGSGYTATPLVSFSGGGGQGAAAIAVVTGGAVTQLILLGRGWGYTSNPTVAITGGGGSGATATATIGRTYPYRDVKVAGVAETLDGSSTLEGQLTIANTDNQATDLVTNAANVRVPVSIQKVWRDSNEAVAATEIWLDGFTGQPSFEGEYVQLACHADVGRRGETPRLNWSEVMTAHAPIQDGAKAPFIIPVT